MNLWRKSLSFLLFFMFLFSLLSGKEEKKSVREKELERMKINDKYDYYHLRKKKEFVVDQSREFLIPPKGEKLVGNFIVAKTPPKIKLMILPNLEPEYFLDLKDPGDAYMIVWANWAHVTRSEDNRFYFAASNHRGYGCQINIYEYIPSRELVHRVVDVKKLLGWTDEGYTDGKIHGQMGIMPDGTLWAATHFGVHPTKEWFKNGYRGAWLLTYNIFTHQAENLGNPIVGGNLAIYQLDEKRGRLVGTGGLSNMVLCYDVINRKVRFAGYPPNNWKWAPRTIFLDKSTGKFWTFDFNDKEKRFFSYDPEFNEFQKYGVSAPKNPYKGKDWVGQYPRGHIDDPAMDGWYYWATWDGVLFKFKPEGFNGKPEVKYVDTTWNKGEDVLQMALSPKGRYVYYYPKGNSPVIQYDVKTGKRKVIAWVRDYYFKKYGYFMGQSYGMSISKDGKFLVIIVNGEFTNKKRAFGHPGILVVEIPESEREE